MKIGIGADHGGFDMKQELATRLRKEGHQIIDFGNKRYDASDDYPDFAILVSQAVASGEVERGVLVCGSGVGASVAANKVPGVRAALCHDDFSARQGVEDDDLTVLCPGAEPWVSQWLGIASATFSGPSSVARTGTSVD